jgi:hypothetical protein
MHVLGSGFSWELWVLEVAGFAVAHFKEKADVMSISCQQRGSFQ